MLGFPSTTEVIRVIPKAAFYENLKLKPQEKRLFVSQIDRITLVNSIKPSTMKIKEGERCNEILVLRIDLKKKEIDGSLLEAIAKQNHRPLVFVCQYLNESCVHVYRQRLYGTEWAPTESFSLITVAKTNDDLWDSICSQIALGSNIGVTAEDLDARLQLKWQSNVLETEVSRLTDRSRKEKQLAKKNKLFEEAQTKQQELNRLKAVE